MTVTANNRLLIISRDTLLWAREKRKGKHVFRVLATITRKGHHLLLTAPEPERWFPTRGSDDSTLTDQGKLQTDLSEVGGDLDGVYYVRKSRFTQNRNREGALQDILARYAVSPEQALLISASRPFIRAADRLGIHTVVITKDELGMQSLENTLDSVAKSV